MTAEEHADKYRVGIMGYTKQDANGLAFPVLLGDARCVEVDVQTHRGSDYIFEHIKATDLAKLDFKSLAMITNIATRLARQAFMDGVQWQQDKVKKALGIES